MGERRESLWAAEIGECGGNGGDNHAYRYASAYRYAGADGHATAHCDSCTSAAPGDSVARSSDIESKWVV